MTRNVIETGGDRDSAVVGDCPRIVIVQCTDTKRDEPAPARDLYDESRYFRRQRAYAEARADAWYIQSAEHGLVDPETTLAPYNTRPRAINTEPWACGIAAALHDRHKPPATVEILGGKAYADPLTPELELLGYDVVEPLRGLGIGQRQAKLKQKTQEVAHARLSG